MINSIGKHSTLAAYLNPLIELAKAILAYRPGRDINAIAGRASGTHNSLFVPQFDKKAATYSTSGIGIRDIDLPVIDPDIHPLQLLGYCLHILASYSSIVLK